MRFPPYALAAATLGLLISAAWLELRSPGGEDAEFHEAISRGTREACTELVTKGWMRGPPAMQARVAACFGLAGDTKTARTALRIGGDYRGTAAIAFDLVHPIADGGDDARTFEVMALVVEADPDHFQALYHAGIGAQQLGRAVIARAYLERFLVQYTADDGYTQNAKAALASLP